ncbi:MAG: hypothetical protein ABIC91_05420 [Nanoarchaeota archaeon]
MVTRELEMFREVGHWKPKHKILRPDDLVSKSDKDFKLFEYVYHLTKEVCEKNPYRKNGEPTLVHPLNVVINLRKAGVIDPITLSIGLLHDNVEDRVDFYQQKHKILNDAKGIRHLRSYAQKMYHDLVVELSNYTSEKNVNIIIDTVKILTRQKKEFYYKSIANMFDCEDKEIKKRAIVVKLADRIHNILSIETFNERERIHECLKNLFILNNTKKYLLNTVGKNGIAITPSVDICPKLFKKCCKATYDAFLKICDLSKEKGSRKVSSLLQLAFKKFYFEKGGLWEVTKLDKSEKHPMRLFQGIIRKYDACLLHNYKMFDEREDNEKAYCRKFFAKLNPSEEFIKAIIDYKDAYALKELVAKLLYDLDYTLPGFLTTDLSKQGRIR